MLFGPEGVGRIHSLFTGKYIGFGRLDKLGALQNLPEQVEYGEDRDTDISGNEIVDTERAENIESVENKDHSEKRPGCPCGIRLPRRFEDQGIAIDALGLESIVKLIVRNTYHDPRPQIGNCS